jgi:antitoxin component YwqK of YwqJK toxin-antitoxin module
MELMNGKKCFKSLLFLFLLSSCGDNNSLYIELDALKDYTEKDFLYEDNKSDELINLDGSETIFFGSVAEFGALTFYNADHKLIGEGSYEYNELGVISSNDILYKFNILNGKVHGNLKMLRTQEEIEGSFINNKFNNDSYKIRGLELIVEASFYQGMMHGRYRSFEKGQLLCTGNYVFNRKVGEFRSYDPTTGALAEIANYSESGKLDGEQKTFYENGNVKKMETYDNGNLQAYNFYNDSGTMIEEMTNNNGVQKVRVLDSLTQTRLEYTFNEKENKFTGDFYIKYDENGRFLGKIDISKIKSGEITVLSPYDKKEFLFINENEFSQNITLFQPDGSQNIITTNFRENDCLKVIRHMRGNRTLGKITLDNNIAEGHINLSLLPLNQTLEDNDVTESELRMIVRIFFENSENLINISDFDLFF